VHNGATSYHLRQLADVGLVREDAGLAKGRERWWRAAHDVSSWRETDFAGDKDATAAAYWLLRYQLNRLVDHTEGWLTRAADAPPAWQAAAEMSDYLVTLSPAQLTELTGELDAVLEKHRRAAAGQPAADAEQVLVYLLAFPRGGRP
jgi:hypothetical protein